MTNLFFILKRLIDIVVAIIGLTLGLPILILIYLLIKIDSKGPVLFKQKRVGKNKKEFEMYKFRTMVVNAEEILMNNTKLLETYKSSGYKIKDDPRVTKVGNFLRKSSMDELPQLLNILKGEMSVVGPRAYKMDEIENQIKKHPELKRFAEFAMSIKPGLTGVWQTSGRSNIGFENRIKMDYEYSKKQSTLFDIWLILKTVPTVLSSRGAY